MEKIYIYGTGAYCKQIYHELNSNYDILGFIEDAQYIKSNKFKNLPIFTPEEAIKNPFDKIIIANHYIQTYDKLIDLDVLPSKILLNEFIFSNLSQKNRILTSSIITFPNEISRHKMFYDEIKPPINHIGLKIDYMRFRTIELLKEQIDLYNINGEIAELGVYRGDFASMLNILFPNKKLYLFDSFEGFNKNEQIKDITNNYCQISNFDGECTCVNTSIDLVLKRMKYKKNCIIKKGFFPDSLDGLEEKFALVSIDADLYDPIYNGLYYFYPRLSKGGYIIIHDYNYKSFFGVKQAVVEYENQFGRLTKVPISDNGGSLIITKPYS